MSPVTIFFAGSLGQGYLHVCFIWFNFLGAFILFFVKGEILGEFVWIV